MKKTVLEQLGIDKELVNLSLTLTTDNFDTYIAMGCRVGYYTIDAKYHRKPHPPFLIPLLIDRDSDPITICLAKHWFTNTGVTYVTHIFDYTRQTLEVARNINQLITFFIISIGGDDDNKNIEKVGALWKKQISKEMISFVDTYGDDINKAINLEVMKSAIPLNIVISPERYNGNAFANKKIFIEKNINNICSYELVDNLHIEACKNKGIIIPEWLLEGKNKKELFFKYYEQNLLSEAWLTLNSTGWKFDDVVWALNLLKNKSKDLLFREYADMWIEDVGDTVLLSKRDFNNSILY